MLGWGSNGLTNISSQTLFYPSLKTKLKPNLNHENQLDALDLMGLGQFPWIGGFDTHSHLLFK